MKIKLNFLEKIKKIFGKNNQNEYIEELNTILLEADIDVNIADDIIESLKSKNINSITELKKELYKKLQNLLKNSEKKIEIKTELPFTILLIGPNGVGKTTTTAKLANFFQKQNKKVIVAAGDTYRAAGIEQLEYLCNKNKIQLTKQHQNADSASVIFDAFNIAKNKNIDILIADTSGRLHTNEKLMTDLKKIDMVLKKINNSLPNEVLIIIDSNFGQNVIKQLEKFNDNIKITGAILTKLDNTAKGGTLLSIVKKNIPIVYSCYGEKIDDIKIFNQVDYIKNLLNME